MAERLCPVCKRPLIESEVRDIKTFKLIKEYYCKFCNRVYQEEELGK